MPKLDFDQALEKINDQHCVRASDVSARALSRVVWVAEWHVPGCMSESFSVCLTKKDAIECALSMAGDCDGLAPRGMKTALMRDGRFDSHAPMYGRVISTVKRRHLRDLL